MSVAAVAQPLMLGSTSPRIFTPPLATGPPGPCGCGCSLTPATSYGFDVEVFAAEVLGSPLDPWQRWLVIHAGELLEDGRPRFRQALVLVARQAGKTFVLRTLSLFWLFVERWPRVVGMSTNLMYAMEPWEAAVDAAEASDSLSPLVAVVRRANGEQRLQTVDGCRYLVAASNRRGGRSLSIDRLVIDELREQHSWEAYNAAIPAMNARPFGQAFLISNQGDDKSVVLDSLRDAALAYIATGDGDPRLGLFEWSAPDGADLDDVGALAQANPNVGRRTDWDTLLGPARRAKLAGGEEEAGFRTESMCQRVHNLDAAVDPTAWKRGTLEGDLSAVRSRVALCVDISPDGQHATLAAAAVLEDGRVRVEIVDAWSGQSCVNQLRAALPGWDDRVRPAARGWFANGPAAALAPDLKATWTELGSAAPAVCMGLAEQVLAERVVHAADDLLDSHVAGAERLHAGDRWVFSRRGGGHCDAAYAAAGAVHLARTLPPPVGRPRIVVARRPV